MTIQPKITTLLFDFGNVIINIDFERTWNKLKLILGEDFDAIYNQWQEDELYRTFEENRFTAKEMTTLINNKYQLNLTIEEVKEIWNALLLEIPKDRIELLNKLRENYNLCLLSNTSHIHIEKIFSDLEKDYSKNPIKDVFHKIYLSFEIGYTKPDRKIYEHVLKDLNLKGEECLFFDDLQENLHAANLLGINTQLVTKEKGIIELLSNYR